MIVTTTNEVTGYRITGYRGIVFGEVITGVNMFRDLFAGVRNIVGGRSAGYEKELTEAREEAISEMQQRAQAAGADYIGVGPIFATRTKRNVCAPVTLDYLDWVAGNISLPFVAIGGIKEHNIAEVARHGAKCCALVSELVGAPDIAARVAAVRAAMHGA